MKSKILSIILKYLRSKPLLKESGINKYRSLLEKSAKIFKIDKHVNFKKFYINSIACQWIIPHDFTGSQTILYLHGGGFIAGSINSHKDLATRIAKESKAQLLIINYRLAPEHKFPAGLNDAITAYEWLLNKKIPSEKITIAGDSAGANLALSLVLSIKEKKIPMAKNMVLLSPWVDLECKSNSYDLNKKKDPMLNKKSLCATAEFYAGQENLSNVLVSPINGNLQGLCPMLIQAGDCEILQDDAVRLANIAEKAGVKVELEIWENMFHVWHYFSRYLPQGRKAIKKIGQFIQTNCHKADLIFNSQLTSQQNMKKY
ncbi:MAG: hypothetical protein B6I26_02390 [Desulfobacteraceae bacterium 4572_130]|nr:MAG: hypothetical protein B6I26_02390 [Desulfobacteraceae bacterium 4572_130]